MLDFTPVRRQEITLAQLVEGLTIADLRRLTDEMVDTMLTMLEGCADEDVTFVPDDPEAYDNAAADPADLYLPWTLGHVVVHTTASSEETASLAAELARGVPHQSRRSRSEVPWQTATTVAQCRQRLEESRRMRLASLAMWPERPFLENSYVSPSGQTVNAVVRFVHGLSHDDSHLGQMREIVRQAWAARGSSD